MIDERMAICWGDAPVLHRRRSSDRAGVLRHLHGPGRRPPGPGPRDDRPALADGGLDGYQYDGMPDDRETWRLVLAGLDETAANRYGNASFAACDRAAAEESSAVRRRHL